MKRTLAGIDVKILPEEKRTGDNPWDRAKIIEANGRHTGLSALNDKSDGFEKLLREFDLGGKTLFIYHVNSTDAHTSTWAISEYMGEIDGLEGIRYPFAQVIEWIDDLPLYYRQKRSKQFVKDHVSRIDKNFKALVETAIKMETPIQIATWWNYTSFGVRYTTENTSPEPPWIRERATMNKASGCNYLGWDDIALTLGIDSWFFERAVDPRLYINSTFVENVLEDKGIVYCLDDLFPDLGIDLRKYMPDSTLWGCGLSNLEELHQWFNQSRSEKYVRKPLEGSQGRGIRIFKKEEFLEGITHHVDDLESIEAAYVNLIIDLLGGTAKVGTRSVIVQDFVPSIPIEYEEKQYDACARAVLANGKYIRGVWRLSLSHLDSHAPDEQKYRANTSLGSETVPLTSEQEDLIATLSERFATDFFSAATALEQRLEHENFSLFANDELLKPSRQIGVLCYLQHLKRSAEGYLDLNKAIRTHLPKDFADSLHEVYEKI